MRILYLHPNSWTGEKPILTALRELGQEVCVLEERRGLASHPWMKSDHFAQPGDGIDTCWHDPGRGREKLLTWPLDRMFKRGFEGRNLVHRMWMVLRAVKYFRPDVIICSDGFTFALPASFLRQLGLVRAPLVVSYIGGDILHCPQADVGRDRAGLTGRLIARSYRGIDIFRPVSPLLRDVLLGDGVEDARIRICPSHLAVPAAVFEKVRANKAAIRRQVRERRGIPQDAPLVVTLSANSKGKAPHIMAEAWPAIARALPGARWLLCGPESDWLRERVLPLIDQGGAGARVIRTGQLDGEAVFEHLAAGDLHVNPTLCEGLNMVTVEAGATGTPTITTSGTGIAAWVARFRAGMVVPAGEGGPLADALIDALLKPSLLAEWSAAATAMSDEFALERVARDLLQILQSATSSSALHKIKP